MTLTSSPRQPFPPPSEPTGPVERVEGERVIASEKLLDGLPCVAIVHQGLRYVLRATRAGKLILTK